MGLGIHSRLAAAEACYHEDHRYVDIAVEFEVHGRGLGNATTPTGEKSPVYGGRWDNEQERYLLAEDGSQLVEGLAILTLPCSAPQLEAITCGKPKLELSGGRGGGKSEGGALRCMRYIAERPHEYGRVISPTMDLVDVVRQKLVEMIPPSWLLPGKQGIRLGPQPLLKFIHGVKVQFRSTNNPDSLRSWGGSWTHVDEAQDVTTYALDVAWPCLRETPKPRMWTTLTPKPGEAYERHVIYAENPRDCACIGFDSYSNPFTSPEVHDIAQRGGGMSKRTLAVEIFADWETVKDMMAEDELKPVFPNFNKATHKWRPTADDFGKEITRDFLKRSGKVDQLSRYNWKYICGVDPNSSVPNYATIWKVYAGVKPHDPVRWVAWDMVFGKGHCGHLAKMLKDHGYSPRETLIVPDASARYNKLGMLKGAMQLMREEGYHVINRARNPRRKNSIEDIEAKLDPSHGPPCIFLRLPQCDILAENLEAVVWDKDGNGFDKSVRPDPVDSARYPVSFFDPAARIARVRGIA